MVDTDAPATEHRSLAELIRDMAEHVHRRFDAIETDLQSELGHLRDRQTAIATALHHILQRDTAMSDLTDTIRAEIATVSSEVDTLIARKQADDTAALNDIKSDMDALKSKVAAALVSGAAVTPVIHSVVEPAEVEPASHAETSALEIPAAS